MHLRLLLLLSFFTSALFGQSTMPVQVTTRMLPPYAVSLADYSISGDNRISFTMLQTDAQFTGTVDVMYRLHIKNLDGLHLISHDAANAGLRSDQTVLHPNVPLTLTGHDLAAFFDPTNLSVVSGSLASANELKDGVYTFTLQVLLKGSEITLSNITKDNFPIFLQRNDPPLLMMPFKNDFIDATNPTASINLTWTPRNISPVSSGLKYLVYLFRIEDDDNPASAYFTMEAFANSKSSDISFAIIDSTVATSYTLTPINYSTMLEGYRYAWMVQAKDPGSHGIFKNNGKSEVFWFKYDVPCPKLIAPVLDPNGNGGFALQLPASPHDRLLVQYRKFGSKDPWSGWEETNPNTNVPMTLNSPMLEAGKTYEVQVAGQCRSKRANLETYTTVPYVYAGHLTIPLENLQCEPPTRFTPKFTATTTSIDFDAEGGVKTYQVYYRTQGAASFQGAVEVSTGHADIPLLPTVGTPIEVRIDVVCLDQSVKLGTPYLITTTSTVAGTCGVPQPFALTTVTDAATKKTTITWPSFPEHTGFNFSYKLQGSLTPAVVANPLIPQVEITGLVPTKVYEYTLTPICNGLPSLDQKGLFMISEGIPIDSGTGSCFIPATIVSEVNDDLTANIAWDKIEGAKGYELFYKQDLQTDDEWTFVPVSGNTYKIKSLSPKTVYQYKVRVNCSDGGQSKYSDIKSFVTDVILPPGSCAKISKVDTIATSKSSLHIYWDSTASTYTSYTVFYKEETQKVTDWYSQQSTKANAIIDLLQSGKVYNVRIEGHCGVKDASNSDVFDFKTKADVPQVCGNGNTPPFTFDPVNVTLKVDDEFDAADFKILVTEISGGPGNYSGKGKVVMPFMNYAVVFVEFYGVNVDKNLRMSLGTVNVQSAKIVPIGTDLADVINDYSAEFDKIVEDVFGAQTLINQIADSLNIDTNATVSVQDLPLDPDGTSTVDSSTTSVATTDSGTTSSTSTGTADPNSTTNNSNTTDSGIGTTSTSSPGIYKIKFGGKLYGEGETITTPFSRKLFSNASYEMVTITEPAAIVEWTTFNNDLSLIYTFKTKKVKIGLPLIKIAGDLSSYQNYSDYFYPLTYKLKAHYADNVTNPEVNVNIVNTVVNFTPKSFTADAQKKSVHDKSGTTNYLRQVKSGGTLYFVNTPIVTDQRVVNFNLIMPSNVRSDLDNVPAQFIQWQANGVNQYKYLGDNTISIKENENKDATVVVLAGYPNLVSNTVNIKWVNQNKVLGSFMPPALSGAVTNGFTALTNNFGKVQTILKKLTGSTEDVLVVDPVKIGGASFNEEDFSSVVSSTKTTQTLGSGEYLQCTEGTLSAGLTIAKEINFVPPPFLFINKSGLAQISIYITPSVKLGVQATTTNKVTAFSKKNVAKSNSVTATLSGCLAGGANFKLLKLESTIKIDMACEVSGCVTGKLGWDFTNNNFIGNVMIDPVVVTLSLHIQTTDAAFFQFDLVNVDASYQILNETPLID